MLEKVAHVNDLSPKLREHLDKKLDGFGPIVRYQFSISHDDPHPDNRGQKLWPNIFTLGPVTWTIVDKFEDRPNVSKQKLIGLVKEIDPEKGHPTAYNRIQVEGINQGMKRLNLKDAASREIAAALELHPKHTGGMFEDKAGQTLFLRIDELARAKASRSTRKERLDAMVVADGFKDDEVRDFVSAMGWDEYRPIDILREELEALADKTPALFTVEFNTGTWYWRATLKRAFDKQIIVHHPVENKVTFTQSGETVTILSRVEGESRPLNQQLAEALMHGAKGETMYKRIKALVDAQKVA